MTDAQWLLSAEWVENSAAFHRAILHMSTTNLFPQSGYNILLDDAGVITFTACARVDDDGSDNRAGDKYWQPETSLKHDGKYLDAETVPYVVLPPDIIMAVGPKVLGCRAIVHDPRTGKTIVAVVGDVGPHLIHKRLGEISMAACRGLGIPPSPINGGEDDSIIEYTIFPGVPAVVNGITYELQSSHLK